MIGVSTERSPETSVVVPHFIFSALAFLMLSILIFFAASELTGYFYNPKILALTHLAALGWTTMIIFGALYQLIPVIFETALHSEKIARINFWIFAIAIIIFTYSFWTGNFGDLLLSGAILLNLSVLTFAYNVLKSIKASVKKNESARFVNTSIYWLIATALVGLLLVLNYKYAFLSQDNFNLLKMHAHFGIIGWLLFLVMGVASILLPMFLVSHGMDERKLKRAYYLVNFALLLFMMDWLIFKASSFFVIYILIFLTGMAFFFSFIYQSYKKKLRKLDIGMKHSMIAFLFMAIPILSALIISISGWLKIENVSGLSVLYGVSIFLGFFSNMILGQTYKTLPFIIWLKKYKHLVGKEKTPMPRELYKENLANIQFYVYLGSVLLVFGGILFSEALLVRIGAVGLIISALLYNFNVFMIVFGRKHSA